jgi:hypothetical protein
MPIDMKDERGIDTELLAKVERERYDDIEELEKERTRPTPARRSRRQKDQPFGREK